ncbi:MAG: DUF6585 family protein [Gemmataceae bacterium]
MPKFSAVQSDQTKSSRTWELSTPSGTYTVRHERGFITESIFVSDIEVVSRARQPNIHFEFKLGRHDAVLERTEVLIPNSSYHLTVEGEVVWCLHKTRRPHGKLRPGDCPKCGKRLIGLILTGPVPPLEFHSPQWRSRGLMIGGIVTTLVALAALIGVIIEGMNGRIHTGSVILLVLLVAGPLLTITARRTRHVQINVDADFLTVADGDAAATVHFDNVLVLQEIRGRDEADRTAEMLDWAVGNAHRLEFPNDDDRVFVVKRLVSEFDVLVAAVKRHLLPRLLPSAIDAFNEAGTLDFGVFDVNRQGITFAKKTLPWSEVSSVEQKDRSIVVTKHGKKLAWAAPSVNNVPNAFVLLALARWATESKQT